MLDEGLRVLGAHLVKELRRGPRGRPGAGGA
jgi:hypothetical protein